MFSQKKGFTLIEVMIGLALVAILVSLALPVFNDYNVRARVAEGAYLAAGIQLEVSDQVDDAQSLIDLAASWNAQAGGFGTISKYVSSVLINNATGEITVTFNAANVGSIAANSTIIYTPYRLNAGALTLLAGTFNNNGSKTTRWGCASQSNAVSAAKGLAAITMGTLNPVFAPNECR